MRRFLALLLLSAALVLGRSPTIAGACSCVPPEMADHLGNAEVVFTGTVVGTTPVPAPDDAPFGGTTRHDVTVDRVYKGDVEAEVVVIGGDDTASCGFAFEPGRYLVYGDEEDGEVHTSLCRGTEALDDDTPVPSELGEGRVPVAVPDGGGGDDESAPPATHDNAQPIGGPGGDVIEPSVLDTFGPVLAVGGGIVVLIAVVLGVRSRRRRPA